MLLAADVGRDLAKEAIDGCADVPPAVLAALSAARDRIVNDRAEYLFEVERSSTAVSTGLGQLFGACVNRITHVLRKSSYLPVGGSNAQAHQFYNRCNDPGFGYGFLAHSRCARNQYRCRGTPLLVVTPAKPAHTGPRISAGLLSGGAFLFNAWRGAAEQAAPHPCRRLPAGSRADSCYLVNRSSEPHPAASVASPGPSFRMRRVGALARWAVAQTAVNNDEMSYRYVVLPLP
jgi:hypothetical protein